MRKIIVLLLILSIFSGNRAFAQQTTLIGEEDVAELLVYGQEFFSDWTMTSLLEDEQHNNVSAIWTLGGVVSQITTYSYSAADDWSAVESFYNSDWVRLVVLNGTIYNIHELASCSNEDESLLLYHVFVTYFGGDYELRYWVQPTADDRVMTVLLTFPAGMIDQLDANAEAMFPQLPGCELEFTPRSPSFGVRELLSYGIAFFSVEDDWRVTQSFDNTSIAQVSWSRGERYNVQLADISIYAPIERCVGVWRDAELS